MIIYQDSRGTDTTIEAECRDGYWFVFMDDSRDRPRFRYRNGIWEHRDLDDVWLARNDNDMTFDGMIIPVRLFLKKSDTDEKID